MALFFTNSCTTRQFSGLCMSDIWHCELYILPVECLFGVMDFRIFQRQLNGAVYNLNVKVKLNSLSFISRRIVCSTVVASFDVSHSSVAEDSVLLGCDCHWVLSARRFEVR